MVHHLSSKRGENIKMERRMLNPNAAPLTQMSRRVNDVVLSENVQPFEQHKNQHSLYVTFSNGFPLTEKQLFEFFNQRYQFLVEEVTVAMRPERTEHPLHGRVVFRNTTIPISVIGNCEKVTFSINDRPFICRRCNQH